MTSEKIIKLLNLSTSPNDNEALSAIRMANKTLKDSGHSWDTMCFEKKAPTEYTALEEMIRVVTSYTWKNGKTPVVQAIALKWKLKKSMTAQELRLLMDFYCAVILK